MCRQQVKKLGKWFGISFLYSGLKWCFRCEPAGSCSKGMFRVSMPLIFTMHLTLLPVI